MLLGFSFSAAILRCFLLVDLHRLHCRLRVDEISKNFSSCFQKYKPRLDSYMPKKRLFVRSYPRDLRICLLSYDKLFEEKEIVERDERTSTLIGRNMRCAFVF